MNQKIVEQVGREAVTKSGRIDESKLFRILNLDTEKVRTKSVPSSSALFTKECMAVSESGSTEYIIKKQLEQLKMIDITIFYIAVLQFRYGLRISEVLDIKSGDILLNGYINIHSKKKSKDRLIPIHDLTEFFFRFRNNGVSPFINYNRFYIYRIYKQVGISHKFGSRSRNSVTHFFRHNLVKSLKSDSIATETTKNFIGHKSIKSTESYEK